MDAPNKRITIAFNAECNFHIHDSILNHQIYFVVERMYTNYGNNPKQNYLNSAGMLLNKKDVLWSQGRGGLHSGSEIPHVPMEHTLFIHHVEF